MKATARSFRDFIVDMIFTDSIDASPLSPSLPAQYLLLLSSLKSRAINLTGIDGQRLFPGTLSANESHVRDSFSL